MEIRPGGKDRTRFRGKTGVFYWITSGLAVGFSAAGCIITGYEQPVLFWITLVILAAVSGLMISFIVRNSIEVTKNEVRICFGVTTKVIQTRLIESVKKVTSVIAGSSASSERLEIKYLNGAWSDTVYISPKKEDEFIELICNLNEEIEVIEPDR